MDDPAQLSAYGNVLLFAIVGLLLVCATLFLGTILSPKNPNPIKLSTYECGEDAIGTSWIQFNPRFYVIALVFLLFDVELIFVFPWATVFGNADFIAADARWGWFTLIEMGLFIGILILGLVYVWKNGDLNWIKPTHVKPTVDVAIPSSAYANLNEKIYVVKDYREATVPEEKPETTSPAPTKATFKPKFKPKTS
ncbi:NADH-quinone oxidoreductase subunit A [Sphingobacterium hungaricum]|uniref:NADH-quinone oxidoreductase subunit A n=1 Tax=Sphingobacterium hungaricum TaxID=2082723 RepID=A0A928UXE9_9SPHI|nr:NADH-quinone oxidoreductase subunit A [Sphingobacterium hungaricum]MBE8713241.1 NADH-quinone oxidoreductase subunit A [Sphingobacterium hungaricum]